MFSAQQREPLTVGHSLGEVTQVLLMSSPQVPSAHLATQYLKGVTWAQDPTGQVTTQLTVRLSPKVLQAAGQTATHFLVELSAYCMVLLEYLGQTQRHMPQPRERSAQLQVGHSSTQVLVMLSAYIWELFLLQVLGAGQQGLHCRLQTATSAQVRLGQYLASTHVNVMFQPNNSEGQAEHTFTQMLSWGSAQLPSKEEFVGSLHCCTHLRVELQPKKPSGHRATHSCLSMSAKLWTVEGHLATQVRVRLSATYCTPPTTEQLRGTTHMWVVLSAQQPSGQLKGEVLQVLERGSPQRAEALLLPQLVTHKLSSSLANSPSLHSVSHTPQTVKLQLEEVQFMVQLVPQVRLEHLVVHFTVKLSAHCPEGQNQLHTPCPAVMQSPNQPSPHCQTHSFVTLSANSSSGPPQTCTHFFVTLSPQYPSVQLSAVTHKSLTVSPKSTRGDREQRSGATHQRLLCCGSRTYVLLHTLTQVWLVVALPWSQPQVSGSSGQVSTQFLVEGSPKQTWASAKFWHTEMQYLETGSAKPWHSMGITQELLALLAQVRFMQPALVQAHSCEELSAKPQLVQSKRQTRSLEITVVPLALVVQLEAQQGQGHFRVHSLRPVTSPQQGEGHLFSHRLFSMFPKQAESWVQPGVQRGRVVLPQVTLWANSPSGHPTTQVRVLLRPYRLGVQESVQIRLAWQGSAQVTLEQLTTHSPSKPKVEEGKELQVCTHSRLYCGSPQQAAGQSSTQQPVVLSPHSSVKSVLLLTQVATQTLESFCRQALPAQVVVLQTWVVLSPKQSVPEQRLVHQKVRGSPQQLVGQLAGSTQNPDSGLPQRPSAREQLTTQSLTAPTC